MAAVADKPTTRWTDKPLAKAALAGLGVAIMSAVSGATWVVKSSVDSKVQEARTEERLKAIDDRQGAMGQDLRELKEDVRELTRRIPPK